jgi:predicted permease
MDNMCRVLLSRLRGLFTKAAGDARFQEEAAAHIEELTDEYVRRGHSPEAARAAARREFGNLAALQEIHREQRSLPWFDALSQDLRYSLRQTIARPGFAVAAILTLGLGIGSNAAIFRVLDAVVLRMLPVQHPEQLVVMAAEQNGAAGDIAFPTFSYPLFREIAARQTVFSGMFAARDLEQGDNSGDKALQVRTVSGNYFQVLGTNAPIGRTLLPDDDKPGAPLVAVISYGYWQREFGGDPAVLGRTVPVNGTPVTVVGVAQRGFFGESIGSAPDAWISMAVSPTVMPPSSLFRTWLDNKGSASLQPVGRLKPGISLKRAKAELSALYSELRDLSPHSFRATSFSVGLQPGGQGLSALPAQYSTPLRLLMAIAGLVLLMACFNLANLLLGHATARAHEMGVRLALGAPRSRLLRQLLTESSVLAALGAGLGFLLASWGSRALVQLAAGSQDLRINLAPDGRLLLFLSAVSVAAVMLFGLAPAIFATRVDVRASLQSNRRAGGGRGAAKLSRCFVTAQIAVSVALVCGAALLTHSFRNLETQDFGYKQQGLLAVRFKLDRALLGTRNQAPILALQQRLQSLSGVRSAAFGGSGLLTRMQSSAPIAVMGDPSRSLNAMLTVASGRYFETMGIPMVAGRGFSDEDRKESVAVAVLSRTAARRLFGTSNPVGRVLDCGKRPLQIVGVAHDVRAHSPREEFLPILYVPAAQIDGPPLMIELVRTAGAPTAFASAVKDAIHAELPSLRVDSAIPVEGLLDGMMQQERTLALLSGAFGLLALLLASTGLYGVIAYSVERRTQELGIRVALGAETAQVTGMLLAEIGRLLAVGVVIGIGGTVLLARGFQSILFGITAHDPATICAAAALLSAVGLGAAYLPARRAGRLDPVEALRMQ